MKNNQQIKKSIIWKATIEEMWSSPYQYQEINLFLKEVDILLSNLYQKYDYFNLKFHIDNQSLKKAIWMLHLDAIDTLCDSIYLLKNKKHRLVGKMFRDIKECLDTARLFVLKPNLLEDWYNNEETPKHREYRKCLKKEEKEVLFEEYQRLSKWTHHGYFNLKHSFSLGRDDLMVYESHAPEVLVLSQTISIYIIEIKNLILQIEKDSEIFFKL